MSINQMFKPNILIKNSKSPLNIQVEKSPNTEIQAKANNDKIKEIKKADQKMEQKDAMTFRSPFHVIGRVYNSSKLIAENSKQISNKKIN